MQRTQLYQHQPRFCVCTGLEVSQKNSHCRRAILDGEIVVLDSKGRSIFADLMMGRGEPSYCAFDLVWLNGRDLRHKPLLERKRLLRQLVPKDHPRLLYMSHLDSGGSHFFELVCEQNLEGIVCKPRTSPYPFRWVKVKNPNYTQAIDRASGSMGHENKGPTSSLTLVTVYRCALLRHPAGL